MPGFDGQIQRIPLRIVSPSNIFTRFNLLRLFPVSKYEEMIWKKEIYYQRAAHRWNRLILKGWTNHIIRTAWKSWRLVGSSVSNWKETMLRNKSINESIKKNVLLYFSKNLLTCLRIYPSKRIAQTYRRSWKDRFSICKWLQLTKNNIMFENYKDN